MNSFNYLFGILLGEWLFAHTDSLSAALQKKDLSAVAGQVLANQTMEILKRIQKNIKRLRWRKKSLPEVSEPALKRKTQAPARYFFGKAPAEYPLTSRDYYRKTYFEAADLLVGHIEDRLRQPSFQIYQRLESLLLDSLSKDIQCLVEDIAYIGSFYSEVDTQSLSVQLELFRAMIGNQKLKCFNKIHTIVKALGTHERSAICSVITIVNLLHVNPSGERTFSTA